MLRFAHLACFTLIVSAIAHADGTLNIVSEQGDYVGRGLTITQTFTDAEVSVTADSGGVTLFKSSEPFWTLSLRANNGHTLSAACYERAQISGAVMPGRPGLEFDYNGSGCDLIAGRFKVIEYMPDGAGSGGGTLAVDFVQHCEGAGPALFGKLRYHSSVPLNSPQLEPVFDTAGRLQLNSDPGDYIGQGRDESFLFDRLPFHSYMNYANGLSAFYFTTEDSWDIDLVAANGAPLTEGSFQDAERFPFQPVGLPGLNFDLDGNGCNELSGWFDVGRFKRDPIDDLPSSVDAVFEQHCENAAPALHGEIAFETAFQNGPFVDDVIYLGGFDEQAAWPLVWDCN